MKAPPVCKRGPDITSSTHKLRNSATVTGPPKPVRAAAGAWHAGAAKKAKAHFSCHLLGPNGKHYSTMFSTVLAPEKEVGWSIE